MSLLHKVKKKLLKFDNERLAIIASLILGIAFLIPLLIINPGILSSEWFLDLFNIIAQYASFIAESAYIGRLINLLVASSFTTLNKKLKTKVKTLLNTEVVIGRAIGIREKRFTFLGMFLGALLAIILIILQVYIPFLNIFSYFAYVLFILGYACSVGGLFNRLGSSLDGTRLQQEKKTILCGIFFGLVVALSLLIITTLTGVLPFIMLASISKIFFDIFLLHKIIFSITFVLCITSLFASFFDYLSKAYCFFNYKYLDSKDENLIDSIKSRKHEYRGAFIGLVVGIVVTLCIIICLTSATSLIVAAFPAYTTFFLITIISVNVISALFSRIGRIIDGIVQLPLVINQKEQIIDEQEKKIATNLEFFNEKQVNIESNHLEQFNFQIGFIRRRNSTFFLNNKKSIIFKNRLSFSMPNLSILNTYTSINVKKANLLMHSIK